MNYRTRLTWTGNLGSGTASYTVYSRDYRATIDGKVDILGTADPMFRGDPAKHSPEDLLLIALTSCHMLSYLALCARGGVQVLEYTDNASGTMSLDANGGGRFEEVILHPCVMIADNTDADRAAALHETAHQLCFIANSCNFPVRHRATIHLAEPR